VIELERPADTHGYDRGADLVSHSERPLLEWADCSIQGSRAFCKNDHTDTVLDMRANAFQSLLELRGPSSPAHRNISETLHHPSIGRNLEMGVEFQSSDKLRNRRVDHKGIEKIHMVADEDTGALTIESRSILYLKSNAGQSQDVPKEYALWPIVPPWVNENAQQYEEAADREKVNDADDPQNNAADEQIELPHAITSTAEGRTSMLLGKHCITSPSTMMSIGRDNSKSILRAAAREMRGCSI